jgi:hypothetical protein
MNRAKIAAVILVAAACSDAPKTAEDSAAAAQAVAEQTIAEQKQELIPKGESASTKAPAPPPATEKPAGEWDVTFAGVGPLKAGMSLDEAKIAMHDNLVIPAKLDECAMIRTKTGPKGILIMVEKNEISRVDVTSGTVATVDGARIGSTEDQIKSLYPGQVEVQPHKYTSGHYLVVTPKGGGENRLVFETDGKKVLRYRSGRMPAVQYVESCA